MKKIIFLAVAILVFGLEAEAEPKNQKVCLHKVCVQVELADSSQERQAGLMFRKSLKKEEGMLFVFETEDKHGFWMKNMNFPIDIIWINAQKIILDIKTGLEPCKDSCPVFIPQEKAKYALELNAGFTQENQIKIGDPVVFNSPP